VDGDVVGRDGDTTVLNVTGSFVPKSTQGRTPMRKNWIKAQKKSTQGRSADKDQADRTPP
jgi:hypothetical protein